MRKIKYRGKRISDGEWFHGDLVTEIDTAVKRAFIHVRLSPIEFTQDSVLSKLCLHEVDIETVGEYTGLIDRNGKDIYEGDIVKGETITWSDSGNYAGTRETLGVVKFEHARFFLEDKETGARPDLLMGSQYHEVIGNIYEEAN